MDKYRDDWADSFIYKRAMKAEAIKRNLPFEEYECEDDDEQFESQTIGDIEQP